MRFSNLKQSIKSIKSIKSNTVFILLSVLLVVGLMVVYMVYTATHYTVEFYQIPNNPIKNNIRIIFISDLHNHEYGENNQDLIENIEMLKPDLILSGGDLVVESDSDYESALNLCRELSEIAPLYGIMGNHEDQRIYIRTDKELREKFEQAGLKLLANEMETVEINGSTIELVGISGGEQQFDKYGAREFMDSLPDKKADVRICICHVPITFATKLNEYSFDLGLSGHTHGGLIRLPKLGALYSSEEGLFPEYSGGLYELENAPLIISRGLGDSSLVPRINNPHELSVIDLKRY